MGFGIYIHIPFCKQKCFYCDFASTAKKVDETLYECTLSGNNHVSGVIS